MKYYDMKKDERKKYNEYIYIDILSAIESNNLENLYQYSSNEDTYIRKATYQTIARLFKNKTNLTYKIIETLNKLYQSNIEMVRQTAINAAGEVGIYNFELVEHLFDVALFDSHHSVRNAVIGSVKKMSEKNSIPILLWAKKYLLHSDKEVRREICHGIELRGRTHPQDILPLLKELQYDTTNRVKTTLIHVLGQISYKKGCLETVISHLNNWENKELIYKAVDEIIDVIFGIRILLFLAKKKQLIILRKI